MSHYCNAIYLQLAIITYLISPAGYDDNDDDDDYVHTRIISFPIVEYQFGLGTYRRIIIIVRNTNRISYYYNIYVYTLPFASCAKVTESS